MKIIFLGTPEFAVPSLKILVDNGYEIPVVITAPGKKAGRGLQIKQPAIKLFADSCGLTTLQPEKLSDPDFINQLKAYQADLFIVVAFRMLPDSVWQIPTKGTFNLHSSLLPQYRGAAPINRAIMNGETQTGVTTFFLKHEIDTGNILFSENTAIGPDETAGELHDRLKIIGADLVLKTVKEIEKGGINETPQEQIQGEGTSLKPAPKIFTPDCVINWSKSAEEVHNLIRGLSPFPGAFTHIEDNSGNKLQLKIYRSKLTDFPSQGLTGTINYQNDKLLIGCSNNFLEITEVQQEGKKRMPASDFLKGFRKEKNWKCIGIN